jgi:hypothetical protein
VQVSTHTSVSTFPFVHEGVCDESGSVRGAGIGTKVRVLKSVGQGAEGCEQWKPQIASDVFFKLLGGSHVRLCES